MRFSVIRAGVILFHYRAVLWITMSRLAYNKKLTLRNHTEFPLRMCERKKYVRSFSVIPWGSYIKSLKSNIKQHQRHLYYEKCVQKYIESVSKTLAF